MAINLESMLRGLEQTGFYEIALPFVLIFTMVFAVLQKVKLFGEDSKKYNVIIAIVMAFLVIRMENIVNSINLFLPNVSLLVVILIMALMLLGIFGAKSEGFTGVPFFIAMVLSIAGIFWALPSTSRLPSWLQISPQDRWTLIGIGVFMLVIYFVTKEGDTAGKKINKGFDDLPGHFGRGGSD